MKQGVRETLVSSVRVHSIARSEEGIIARAKVTHCIRMSETQLYLLCEFLWSGTDN